MPKFYVSGPIPFIFGPHELQIEGGWTFLDPFSEIGDPPPSRPCLHKHLVLRAQSYDSIDFKTEYIKKGRIFWHAIFGGFLTGGSPHLSRE